MTRVSLLAFRVSPIAARAPLAGRPGPMASPRVSRLRRLPGRDGAAPRFRGAAAPKSHRNRAREEVVGLPGKMRRARGRSRGRAAARETRSQDRRVAPERSSTRSFRQAALRNFNDIFTEGRRGKNENTLKHVEIVENELFTAGCRGKMLKTVWNMLKNMKTSFGEKNLAQVRSLVAPRCPRECLRNKCGTPRAIFPRRPRGPLQGREASMTFWHFR